MVVQSIETPAIDKFAQRWVEYCAGGLSAGLVYLGEHLGLFTSLREDGPATVEELSSRTGLVERYVREWLAAMATSDLLDYSAADGHYYLNSEQRTCFADPDSLRYVAPLADAVVRNLAQADHVIRAFREGGGVPFDAYGPNFTNAMDDLLRPLVRAKLLPEWLPAVPGAIEKLQAGGAFLDVGCGGGLVCLEVARAFPRATVVGVDRHAPSMERARANAREAGVDASTTFNAVPIEEQTSSSFDLVTSFDFVHDLGDPIGVLRAIRALLKPDGSYVMVEGHGVDRREQGSLPMRMGYGFSMFHCLPQSMNDGGVGLGGMLREATARDLATEAGFRSFSVLPIEDRGKIFYHLLP